MITLKTMPISTNQLYQGRKFLTKKGKANKEAIAWEAKVQMTSKMLLKGPIKATVRLFWPDRRNHDIENLKALFDSLSGIAYEDDGQIQELHIFKSISKLDPRTEIEVSVLEQ